MSIKEGLKILLPGLLVAGLLILFAMVVTPTPDERRKECAKKGMVFAEYMHGGAPQRGCVTVK